MGEIIDLDAVLPPDKKVKLAGVVYTLPPDLPAELYLRVNQFAQDEGNDTDTIQILYDELLGLFRYKKPGLEALPISMGQLVVAVSVIYGDRQEDDAAPPRRAGTRSTRRSKRSGSST